MREYQAGFKKLVVWKNAYELRLRVYNITKRFPKAEHRRVSQMRDAARSVKQNIQEGYSRASVGEYIQFLNVSKGSLSELSGDVEDCHEDKLVSQEEFKSLDELCGKSDYLFSRLIQALARKQKEGTWRKITDL